MEKRRSQKFHPTVKRGSSTWQDNKLLITSLLKEWPNPRFRPPLKEFTDNFDVSGKNERWARLDFFFNVRPICSFLGNNFRTFFLIFVFIKHGTSQSKFALHHVMWTRLLKSDFFGPLTADHDHEKSSTSLLPFSFPFFSSVLSKAALGRVWNSPESAVCVCWNQMTCTTQFICWVQALTLVVEVRPAGLLIY